MNSIRFGGVELYIHSLNKSAEQPSLSGVIRPNSQNGGFDGVKVEEDGVALPSKSADDLTSLGFNSSNNPDKIDDQLRKAFFGSVVYLKTLLTQAIQDSNLTPEQKAKAIQIVETGVHAVNKKGFLEDSQEKQIFANVANRIEFLIFSKPE